MGLFRMVLDSLIVGSAALAAAGFAEKVAPGLSVAGVNLTPFGGAAIGAGLAIAVMVR